MEVTATTPHRAFTAAWPGMDRAGVRIGARFRHYEGDDYRVICWAIDESTLESIVVYARINEKSGTRKSTGGTYSLPFASFVGTVEYQGRTVRRFVPLFA